MKIVVKRITKESRKRDIKRRRLLLNLGREVVRLPREEAVELHRKLGSILNK